MNLNDKMRTLFSRIAKRYPYLGAQIVRLYNGKIFNQVVRKISGKNNRIECAGSILLSVTFDIIGNGNRILIKKAATLKGVTVYVRGDNHEIIIGEYCKFTQGGSLWLEDSDCSLRIGEKSTFGDVHIAVTEPGSRVSIGDDCMFSYDIDIRTGDSHSIFSAATGERVNYAKDIHIGNHVWVGAHCILTKGANILDNSVVGSGAIVSRSFQEKGVIIAGNPARIVKKGITWSRQRVYEAR